MLSLLASQALCTQRVKKKERDVQKECLVESRFMGWPSCRGYGATTFLGQVALGINT